MGGTVIAQQPPGVRVAPDQKTGVTSQLVWAFQLLQVLAVGEAGRAVAQLRPMAGISEDAWNVAQKIMGPGVAAAAIALIFDKHTDGEVKSPGGYLRGMVEKARAGELHLDRSFYGRLNEVRAV